MLLLTAGLLVSALARRRDVAVPYVPPATRPDDDDAAAVLAFPKEGKPRK
jgi:hypothetical protein